MKKKLFTNCIALSLLLGLSATAFAGMGIPGNSPHIGTEAGVDIVASEKAKTVVTKFDYNAAQLAQVGTEAGADVIASEKAKIATENYDYNAVQLAQVGTEAGYDPTGISTASDLFNTETALDYVAEKDKADNKAPCRC